MQVTRIGQAPIIVPHMDARMGDNINGPSPLRVPDWLPAPLGRYYLYFAHHDGHYIRLAFADQVEGPWRTYEPGVLSLEASGFAGHIASPDVHVDEQRHELRMYFHGCDQATGDGGRQYTRLAVSADGLLFRRVSEDLCPPYLRVFSYRGHCYGITMPGRLWRSPDGRQPFEAGPQLLEPATRHCAVLLDGDRLLVCYTRVGDSPERLVARHVTLSADWQHWQAGPAFAVLSPERGHEGADCPPHTSVRGMVDERVRALRDPGLLCEDDAVYLFYAVAGEHGIGLARIDRPWQPGAVADEPGAAPS